MSIRIAALVKVFVIDAMRNRAFASSGFCSSKLAMPYARCTTGLSPRAIHTTALSSPDFTSGAR
jgi:hypothetical protein